MKKHIYVFSGKGAEGKTTLALRLNPEEVMIVDDFACYRPNCKELIAELEKSEKPFAVIVTDTLNEELTYRLKKLDANVTIAEFKRL